MQQLNISLPWSMTYTDQPDGFAYVDNIEGLSCHAPTAALAKKRLRGPLRDKIADMAIQDSNSQRYIIGCNDGTVFLVNFQNSSWGYAQCGPNLNYGTAYWSPADNFRETVNHALSRAEDHGGTAWQQPV